MFYCPLWRLAAPLLLNPPRAAAVAAAAVATIRRSATRRTSSRGARLDLGFCSSTSRSIQLVEPRPAGEREPCLNDALPHPQAGTRLRVKRGARCGTLSKPPLRLNDQQCPIARCEWGLFCALLAFLKPAAQDKQLAGVQGCFRWNAMVRELLS